MSIPHNLEIMDEVFQHQQTTLSILSQQVQAKIQMANQDLQTIINAHPFFVLFEPRLGCNAQSDHTVSRSVLPVFRNDFTELFASLQCQILKELEPTIIELVQNTEMSWKGENGEILKKYKEVDFIQELQKRKITEYEQIIKDLQLQKDTIQKKLQSEILALREMLFQSKRIGMPVYKPDYDGFQKNQEQTKDVFSKKEHDEIVAEILTKHSNLQKKLEEKYKNELAQLLSQLQSSQKENLELRTQIEELESQLKHLNAQHESDLNGNNSEYESLILSLQTQLADLQQKLKSTINRYEDIIEEKDEKIQELEAQLSKFRALQQLSKDDLERQKKEYDELSAKNQADAMKGKITPDIMKEMSALKEQIARLQELLDDAERQKKYVEDAYNQLKGQQESNNGEKVSSQTFEDATAQDIKDLQNLLQQGKIEYDQLKNTANQIFNSLFDLQKGGITRFALYKDKKHSPYEQLRSDMKRVKVGQEQLKPMAKSLSLIKQWCQQFCPDAEKQSLDDFDFDALNKNTSNNTGNNQIVNNEFIEKERTPTPGAVNSVLLHPSVQQTDRLKNGDNFDIGINTSICTSLDDGPVGMGILVDKSVMYECERCNSNRSSRSGSFISGSRPNSRPGSGVPHSVARPSSGNLSNINNQQSVIEDEFQQRNSQTTQPLNTTQDRSLNHTDDLHFSNHSQLYNSGNNLVSRPGSSMYNCPDCNRSSQVSRIEIIGSNGTTTVNVNGVCGDCNAHSQNPQISCQECDKPANVSQIKVYGDALYDDEDEVDIEYFGEDDWVTSKQNSNRPSSGIRPPRPNSGNYNQKLQKDAVLSPNSNQPEQSNLTYACPHCHKITDIGKINLLSNTNQDDNAIGYPTFVFDQTQVDPSKRINSAPQPQQKYDPHHRILSAFNPKSTKTDTTGVFDRLILRARELQVRFDRKRDLILQERKRTTERVLRSLSLFIDNFPSPDKGIFSVKEARSQLTQSKLQKASQIVQFQNSAVSMKFNSPVKRAFGRPVSSKVDDLEISQLNKVGFRQRTMSGQVRGKVNQRQDGVMKLLAASGVLKK